MISNQYRRCAGKVSVKGRLKTLSPLFINICKCYRAPLFFVFVFFL